MVEITVPLMLDVIRTVGILVGIVYYITIMRNSQKTQQNQLETRQAQLYMQLFNVETSRDFHKSIIDIETLDFTNFEELMRQLMTDIELTISLRVLMFRYDGIGVMLISGLLEPDMILHFGHGVIPIRHWQKLKPFIEWRREKLNALDFMAGFEFYVNELIRLRKDRGYSTDWSLEESRWL